MPPATQGTVDPRHDGDADLPHDAGQPAEVRGRFIRCGRKHGGAFSQVRAGTEGFLSGAGQHHRAQGRIRRC
jgi:hypothetical protein